MAIAELIFPAFKPTKEVIDEIEGNWPALSKDLINPNPGLLSAFRGWILSENNKDVRYQHRGFLISEWVEEASFHAFVKSDQFASFVKVLRPLIDGPPTIQLYKTDISPKSVAVAPVVEIYRLSLSDSERVEEAQEAWKIFSQTRASIEEQETPSVSYGRSLNLDGDVVVGILGWASMEDREKGVKNAAFETMLSSLRLLGELSHIIVDVAPMELPHL